MTFRALPTETETMIRSLAGLSKPCLAHEDVCYGADSSVRALPFLPSLLSLLGKRRPSPQRDHSNGLFFTGSYTVPHISEPTELNFLSFSSFQNFQCKFSWVFILGMDFFPKNGLENSFLSSPFLTLPAPDFWARRLT